MADELDDVQHTPRVEEPASDEATSSSSRRSFTKAGIVGAAVVFSLANRTAWGIEHEHPVGCQSLMHSLDFASLEPTGQTAAKLQECGAETAHTHVHTHPDGTSHEGEHISHDHTHDELLP